MDVGFRTDYQQERQVDVLDVFDVPDRRQVGAIFYEQSVGHY
jgi:hypothetical protein